MALQITLRYNRSMFIRIFLVAAITLLHVHTAAANQHETLNSAQGQGSAVSDPGSGSILQPANPNTLQAGEGSGGAQQAPSSNNLQPAGNRMQFENLNLSGEIEGIPGDDGSVAPEEEESNALLYGIIFAILILGGILLMLKLENNHIRSISKAENEPEPNSPSSETFEASETPQEEGVEAPAETPKQASETSKNS